MLRDTTGEFVATRSEVFGEEVDDLRTVVRGGLGPAVGSGARGFDGVADVFAIACTDFADEIFARVINVYREAAVGARLFAIDEHFGGAVDGGNNQ